MTVEKLAQHTLDKIKQSNNPTFDIITIIALITAINELIKLIQECQKKDAVQFIQKTVKHNRNKHISNKILGKLLPWGKKNDAAELSRCLYNSVETMNEEEIKAVLNQQG